MSPDVRDREKPVRPRSRTPDERDAESKRRKETIKREVSTCRPVDLSVCMVRALRERWRPDFTAR